MATKRQREARAAMLAWWKKHPERRLRADAVSVRHIRPTSYVIGHAAPHCLIVVTPWMEAEPHMRDWDRQHPLQTITTFDQALKAGDWCIVAYVATKHGGENVAIPVVEGR